MKDQPCSYDRGLFPPSFPNRRSCLGKIRRCLREKSDQMVRKVSIAAGPTPGLSVVRRALQGECLRLSALHGTRWLFGAPPASLEGQVYLVYLQGEDLTCAGLQSCMEAACPGHALEHMGDRQGSVVLGRTLAMSNVSLWAGIEPPPSSEVFTGEVPASVATGREGPHPLTPLYLLSSHPLRPFLTIFHAPVPPPFPPVFPYLSIPLGLLSIS